MSRARQIVPGTTYLVTRRVSQRQFWIRPSIIINRILLYCLAVAAKRYGVEIHVVCFMSNHWHAVVTDFNGNMPEFLAWFHKYVANCVNDTYDREESLWSSQAPNYKALESDEAVLAATLYCMANPVEAELVETSNEWPGICTLPEDIAGSQITVERPTAYFAENGKAPTSATLTLTRPPMFANLSDEAIVKLVSDKHRRQEKTIGERMKTEGKSFRGADVVLATNPWARPTTKSRKPAPEIKLIFQLLSTAARESAQRRRAFQDAYTDARERFKAGDRDVVFPAGTYALARRYGVAVEPYKPV